ncbi:MAG: hypothetical protein LBS76_04520 [Mycoplasmataceae bacterium]|nr:hypothetical protein [Mycoplasmataceae bacterium]
MKIWPKRLWNAGIACTISGIVMFTIGLSLSIYIMVYATENPGVQPEYIADMMPIASALIGVSWGLLLVQGIAMWIVGGIFKSKYAKQQATQTTTSIQIKQ